MIQVHKFGGTCTASKNSINRLVEVASSSDCQIVITLSASHGVTNKLVSLIKKEKFKDNDIMELIAWLRDLHLDLLPANSKFIGHVDILLQKLQRMLFGVLYTEELTPRTHDLLLTFGERLIVVVVNEYFLNAGIRCNVAYPEDLILTDGVHTSSMALLEESKKKSRPIFHELIRRNEVIIVPGFYGISESGIVTLFGRSGTDYTATVLGYILDAASVTIWKDVNGFMSADPNIVDNAHTISQLSYDEAAELSYFGAALLHSRAIGPSRLKEIPIFVRHIDDLNATTVITNQAEKTPDIIKSISHMRSLSILKVYTSVEGNKRGRFATISKKVEDQNISIISIATSQTCIAFLINRDDLEKCIDAINRLNHAVVDNIEIDDNIGLICLVGKGLATTPGVASRVFGTMANEKINVELISAGASTCAFHFTLKEKDLNTAIKSFHKEFFS